jgi:hypothetical protein
VIFEELTSNIKLGALIEETKTFGTRPGADEAAEGTRQKTLINGCGVTGVRGLVAARELGLVTALVGGLLDGHVFGDRELDVAVALVANTIASELGIMGRREGRDGGGESNDSGSNGELHCEEVEVGFFGFWRRGLRMRDWTVYESLVERA